MLSPDVLFISTECNTFACVQLLAVIDCILCVMQLIYDDIISMICVIFMYMSMYKGLLLGLSMHACMYIISYIIIHTCMHASCDGYKRIRETYINICVFVIVVKCFKVIWMSSHISFYMYSIIVWYWYACMCICIALFSIYVQWNKNITHTLCHIATVYTLHTRTHTYWLRFCVYWSRWDWVYASAGTGLSGAGGGSNFQESHEPSHSKYQERRESSIILLRVRVWFECECGRERGGGLFIQSLLAVNWRILLGVYDSTGASCLRRGLRKYRGHFR